MICPCKNCLVYVRCKQRVEKIKYYYYDHQEIDYQFGELIDKCEELRIFFGVNSIFHKVNMKSYRYKWTQYLIKLPRGKQLVEEFLSVMKVNELPTALNYKMKVKAKGKQ